MNNRMSQREAEVFHLVADLLEKLGWALILFAAGFWLFEIARAALRGVLLP